MGAALHRTLADSAASTQRWDLGGTRQGNAAGRRRQSPPGQSLSALRVRRLDESDVSGRTLVSVRRRRADTLRNGNAGASHLGGACRSTRGVRPRDPPRRDAYCLLQGRKSQGEKGLPSSLMQLDTIRQFIANLLLVCACGALSIPQWPRVFRASSAAERALDVM